MGLIHVVDRERAADLEDHAARSGGHRTAALIAMTLALIALAVFLVIAGPAQAACI